MFHKSCCQSAEQQHSLVSWTDNNVNGGCDPQTSVPGNRNNARLENLLPDTPYSITVEPLYLEGPGAELSGNGRTGQSQIHPVSSPFQGYTHPQGCENKHHKSTRTQEFFLTNIRENGAEKQAVNTRQLATNVYWCSTQENQGLLQLHVRFSNGHVQ